MIKAFDRFLAAITRDTDIGTVLFLGIESPDLAPLLNLGAKRVALAIPAPLVSQDLSQQSQGNERVSLHPVLVSQKQGRARLSRFNFGALSSTRKPGERMQALFPGLKAIERIDVDTRPLRDLSAEWESTGDLADILVIDLPGEETTVLSEVANMAPARRFAHVLLRAGQEALYDGALAFDRLAAQLTDAGYRIAARNLDDPDFPCAHFRLEPLALQVADLDARLAAAVADASAAQEAAKKRLAELEGALEDKETSLSELAERLKSLDAERDKEREGRKAVEAERDKEREGRRTAEAHVAELKKVLDENDKALKANGGKIAKLEQDIAQAGKRQKAIENELTRAEAQIDLLRDIITGR